MSASQTPPRDELHKSVVEVQKQRKKTEAAYQEYRIAVERLLAKLEQTPRRRWLLF